jgi:hypothetical protein
MNDVLALRDLAERCREAVARCESQNAKLCLADAAVRLSTWAEVLARREQRRAER